MNMEEIAKYLKERVGLPEGKPVTGIYTNGFVSFTLQHISEGKALIYANTDIPYLELSEDESREMGLEELTTLFVDLLGDFRLTRRLDEKY